MDSKAIINLKVDTTRKVTKTLKPFTEFKAGEHFYTRRVVNKHNYDILCEFIKVEGPYIKAKIKSLQSPEWQVKYREKEICKLTVEKCYVWAFDKNLAGGNYRCFWFQAKGLPPE